MKSIRLIEFRIHHHILEKKRIKRHPVRARKLGIMGLNSSSYFLPQFGEACIPASSSLAPLALIFPINLSRLARTVAGGNAAQHVVGAEFEDHEIGIIGE